MANDIKSLLDSIIDNTNKSFPDKKDIVGKSDSVGAPITRNNFHPVTFDAGKFREKLSLYVLKDLICAMMHDETQDLDEMIDNSIIQHIKTNYNGSCYGYLCNARDRLKSPLIGDIIQEIDDQTKDMEDALNNTKDEDLLNGEIDTDTLLKDVTNYDDFRNKLKDAVSNKVVQDVANVITERNDAPVFDKIDNELKRDVSENKNDITKESVILSICGSIVTESAINKNPIDTETGMNMAIVEYCIAEMDFLFKANPKVSIYTKYKI